MKRNITERRGAPRWWEQMRPSTVVAALVVLITLLGVPIVSVPAGHVGVVDFFGESTI